MKNLIVTLILCAGFLSCEKESKVTPRVPPTAEIKGLGLGKKIKVFLYKNPGGETLNFSIGYRTPAVADELTDALWYLHNCLSTNDTSHAYLHPYTSVMANSGFLYAYPDSALQADPEFDEFEVWFEKIVSKWMTKSECSGCIDIIVSPGAVDYFSKIRCTIL